VRQRVFVYGTLLQGEVNHDLLAGARRLGVCRTPSCLRLFLLGAYPGAVLGGRTAVSGEVYEVDGACMGRLDRLEEYPVLYDRRLIPTVFGRAWIYLYRGRLDGCPVIRDGDWRRFAADPRSCRAAGVRASRDPKTRRRAVGQHL
jgi:gamma-glutamylaminecyclotransferase